MEDEMYVVLPSNVNSYTSIPNKTSEFITLLPVPLQLDRSWSVALTEISYPHSFKDGIHGINCDYKVGIANLETEEPAVIYDACSQKGYDKTFYNFKDLIESLNENKPLLFKGWFIIDDTKRIKIILYEGESIQLSKELSDILGFKKEKYFHVHGVRKLDKKKVFSYEILSEMKPDIRMNTNNLFIYCNLVEPYLVGDRKLNLLRTVPVEHNTNEQYVSKAFEMPRYLRLSSEYFQSIEIKITNSLGENIQFEWGKVILSLHFKRKPKLIYNF